MIISHRSAALFSVAVATSLLVALNASGVEHWSVDFQGVGGPLYNQEDPPVLMTGPDPVLGLGNVWNAFDVDGHDLPAMEDPSLTLVDRDGASGINSGPWFGTARRGAVPTSRDGSCEGYCGLIATASASVKTTSTVSPSLNSVR